MINNLIFYRSLYYVRCILEFVLFLTHYLLCLVFTLCNISQHLIQQQRFSYVFLISFLRIPYILLMVSRYILLQIQALRVGQVKEPCIGLTQENSIESSVQDSLPYIPRTHGPCQLFLTHPKQPCIYHKVNMCSTCCMTSSFQNLLPPSVHHVTCDCVSVIFVTKP